MISKGNHVKFARIVLLAVSEEATATKFYWLEIYVITLIFRSIIIKQLLDSVFVISGIIKVSVRIILDITKTPSNNRLLYLLVSTCSVTGQFSGPYSTVRPAKYLKLFLLPQCLVAYHQVLLTL